MISKVWETKQPIQIMRKILIYLLFQKYYSSLYFHSQFSKAHLFPQNYNSGPSSSAPIHEILIYCQIKVKIE